MTDKQIQKIEIKIEKHGRTWTRIEFLYKNRPKKGKVQKANVATFNVGDKITVNGYIDWHDTGYGSDPEVVIPTEEQITAEKETQKEAEIQRWLGYFNDSAARDYYYEKAVTKIHSLGCREYDALFRQTRLDIAWRKVQSAFQQGYISEKFVTELYKLGCSEHDEEIRQMRSDLRERKRQEAAANGITKINIPAYCGWAGRPAKGERLMHKGVPYEVISCYYHDADGFSFGVLNDEWYELTVKNISDSSIGQRMIEEQEHERKVREKESAVEKAKNSLSGYILAHGTFYDGPEIGISDIPGDTVWDTFDIYGGGDMLVISGDTVWLVKNNGADGDNWGSNHIRTGGAGAYAHTIPLAEVKELYEAYWTAASGC